MTSQTVGVYVPQGQERKRWVTDPRSPYPKLVDNTIELPVSGMPETTQVDPVTGVVYALIETVTRFENQASS